MKRYVLQYKKFRYDPWQVVPGREYDTLEEVKAAFESLPVKSGYRIAEAYIQVRYKAVNTGAPEPLYRLPTPPPPAEGRKRE